MPSEEYRESPLMVMSLDRFTEIPPGDTAPRYHNFLLYFRDTQGMASTLYRATDHWKRFVELDPERANELTAVISELEEADLHGALKELEADLFEAYKTMRALGATDNDLAMTEHTRAG